MLDGSASAMSSIATMVGVRAASRRSHSTSVSGGELGQPPRVHARRGTRCPVQGRDSLPGPRRPRPCPACAGDGRAGGRRRRPTGSSGRCPRRREQDPHRPVRGAGIEPVRCTIQDRRAVFGGQGGERRREAGLADPAVADDATVRPDRPGRPTTILQALDLRSRPDQRRLPSGRDPAGPPVHSHDLVGRHYHTVTQHGPGRGVTSTARSTSRSRALLMTMVPGRAACWSLAARLGVCPKASGPLSCSTAATSTSPACAAMRT